MSFASVKLYTPIAAIKPKTRAKIINTKVNGLEYLASYPASSEAIQVEPVTINRTTNAAARNKKPECHCIRISSPVLHVTLETRLQSYL